MTTSTNGAAQVALVTGAGRGIGREIAVRLAMGGYRLGLVARSADELAETGELVGAAGAPVVCVTGDVTEPADVARAYETVLDRLGPVDLLVNNAAYFGTPGEFLATDPTDWWRVLEINVRGPVLLNHRVLPGMLDRGRGRLITINSLAAVVDGDPAVSSSAYSVSKAAVLRFDAILANELAGTGVTVFSMSPGLVRTRMAELRPDIDQIPSASFQPASAAANMVAALASGRYDGLHGRFLHVRDDLDALLDAVARHPRTRTLEVVPALPVDRVF